MSNGSGSALAMEQAAVLREAQQPVAINYQVFRDGEISSLEPHWRSLELSVDLPIPFNRVGFLRAWADTRAKGEDYGKLCVVTGWQDDRLVVLLPLVIRKSGGLSMAEWMGHPFCEYGDALIDPGLDGDDAMNAVADALDAIPGADIIHLRRVRANSVLGHVMNRRGRTVGDAQNNAVIALKDVADIDAFHAKLKSSMRRELKRKRKQAHAEGHVTFTAVTDPEARRTSVRKALAFKAQWLEDRGLVSQVFGDPTTEDLLLELADSGEAGLVVTQLELDGEPIAIELGLRTAERYYAYMGTFSSDHAYLGVGSMQMEDTIAWCIQNGIESYDLFAPADNYKRRWTPDGETIRDYAIAGTLPGYLALGYREHVRPRAKAWFESLPTAWRKRLSGIAQRIARI